MQTVKSALPISFPIQEHEEKTCPQCGRTYMLYQTPKGIMGTCKHCIDQKLLHEIDVPPKKVRLNRRKQRFIRSFERITDDLGQVTLASYYPRHTTQIQAKKMATAYVQNFDGVHSLLFSGHCGLGKSHLAYAMTKALSEQGYKALYIKVTDLLDFIRNTYQANASLTATRIFDMLNDLDLLVLDDIGSEYVKSTEYGHESWASDVLYKVFDMRLNKAMVCTTNYSESDLIHKYGNNGQRIVDRMMDLTKAIRLEGESYRRKERF